jgi:hypothetical protein
MAYLARIEPLEVDAVGRPAMSLPAIARPSFSSLEWSIIRLARGQDLSTIREPGLLRRFYYWLIGRRGNRGLANERLEALRRMAVLSWHFDFFPSRARTSPASCRPDSRAKNMSCWWPAPVPPRSSERSVGRYSPDVSAQG